MSVSNYQLSGLVQRKSKIEQVLAFETFSFYDLFFPERNLEELVLLKIIKTSSARSATLEDTS